jgi:hypothetical protein
MALGFHVIQTVHTAQYSARKTLWASSIPIDLKLSPVLYIHKPFLMARTPADPTGPPAPKLDCPHFAWLLDDDEDEDVGPLSDLERNVLQRAGLLSLEEESGMQTE